MQGSDTQAVDDTRTTLIELAIGRLGRVPRVVDVGAQTLADGIHPYTPLAAVTPLQIVGFDPLEDRLAERAAADGPGVTLLPFALGDGDTHTLYVNNDDATSSLFPLATAHNAQFDHLHTLHTVRTTGVQTRRLDDVLPDGPVDLLKLDVQGAELMVIEGGPNATARAATIHCEVQFSRLYVRTPVFSDIERELSRHGFYLVDLVIPHRYHYRATGIATPDRLLWADAVFFRTTDDPDTRAAQALIAAAMYGKLSLAAHLLSEAT